ncbi:MAG TPA: hypothetical protein VGJ77_20410 [Gaiellaceae bacterium]|jgi:hypothetical protein
MRRLGGMLVLVAFATGLAGCGGKSEAEKEREREAKSGRGTVTCAGKAMSGETGLPADFPSIEGVIFVQASETGPSHVVDGYAEKGLKELYESFESGFEDAGYTVLFDEIEEDDAEVSYKTKDEASEGQVALRSCDEDKTSVHITNRPE